MNAHSVYGVKVEMLENLVISLRKYSLRKTTSCLDAFAHCKMSCIKTTLSIINCNAKIVLCLGLITSLGCNILCNVLAKTLQMTIKKVIGCQLFNFLPSPSLGTRLRIPLVTPLWKAPCSIPLRIIK